MSNNTDEENISVNVAVMQPCKEAIAIIGKTQVRVPKFLKQSKTRAVNSKTDKAKTVRKTTTRKKSNEKSLDKGE